MLWMTLGQENSSAPSKTKESRREAIEYAIRQARRGDLILLAGKGHEDYEIDIDGKKPFCEKEIVRLAVEKYFG